MEPALNRPHISAFRGRIPQIRFDVSTNQFILIYQRNRNNIILPENDFFRRELENCDNEQKQIEQQKQQQQLINRYPFTKIILDYNILEIMRNNHKFDTMDFWTGFNWFQVEMATDSLNYTTSILINRPYEGLMYILLNNWECLSKWIPSTERALRKLQPIWDQLEKLKISTKSDNKALINELCDAVEQLDSMTFYAVQYALFEIQMHIYLYIKQIVWRQKSFLGKQISFRNFIKLYFKIPHAMIHTDDINVLCLVISKETYSAVAEFCQPLPIRVIQFAYGTNEKEYTEQTTQLDFDARVRILKSHKNQQAETTRTLTDAFPSAVIVPMSKLSELRNLILAQNFWWLAHDQRMLSFYTKSLVLHVKMPEKFGFTCAIVSKNIRVGLLHSIARHSDQWSERIRGFGDEMDKLGLVREQLDYIKKVDVMDSKHKLAAYQQYETAHEQVKLNVDFQLALLQAQLQILELIQQIVLQNDESYSGETINNDGLTAVLFKVMHNDEAYLLNLAVSKELFPPIPDSVMRDRFVQ